MHERITRIMSRIMHMHMHQRTSYARAGGSHPGVGRYVYMAIPTEEVFSSVNHIAKK